jgi:hypothetical protein
MTELPVSELRRASSGKAAAGRLFVLELNAGRIHLMNPDGSDKKTISVTTNSRDMRQVSRALATPRRSEQKSLVRSNWPQRLRTRTNARDR